MLCNQTTSYFNSADVITCSSTHSKKGLPYLLVLATQNPRVDKFMLLLNLDGNAFYDSALNTIQLLVIVALITSAYMAEFLLHAELSEHTMQHSLSITLS